MEDFETLLAACRPAVERYVRFRVPERADAEDILQETYLAAFRAFPGLREQAAFKGWLLQIARNKVNDWFRTQAKRLELPLDSVPERELSYGRLGPVYTPVEDVMERLESRDRQILYLFYWRELPQADIARRLQIPLGTVKSRLHAARRHFKARYPSRPAQAKGESAMIKELPAFLPEYTIEKLDLPPFETRWEELPGWLLIPREGEKLRWGLYEFPSRRRTEWSELETVGRVEIHGVEGVEFTAVQHGAEDYYRTGCIDRIERRFAAQLTDTHVRFLAESHVENGVRKCFTFLDGNSFLDNWGFGPDNCGQETHLRRKGILHREGDTVTGQAGPNLQSIDVTGRYRVTINGKSYDTVCVIDIECFDDAVVSEDYVDQNGRTVLWRRYNRDDWALERYHKPWTRQLPHNHRLTVNGQTFVHWYDCVTDYIF